MEALKYIPPAMLSLHKKLEHIPAFALPSELEVAFYSANAIQVATNDIDHFSELIQQGQKYPSQDHNPDPRVLLPTPYCHTMPVPIPRPFEDHSGYDKAKRAFRMGAYERYRGTLVSELVFEVGLWAREGRITALNV